MKGISSVLWYFHVNIQGGLYLFTDVGELVDWVVGVYRSSSGCFDSLETKFLVENCERNPWKDVHPGR